MTNMIYSSLDKKQPHSPNAVSISLSPTLANRRFLAAYLNELLDTCEFECTATVQEFADKFIGEPVGLAEGSLMMQLYDNTVRDVAQRIARTTCDGEWISRPGAHPEITLGYQWVYLMYKVMTKECLGIGLKPFSDQMHECIKVALSETNTEAVE